MSYRLGVMEAASSTETASTRVLLIAAGLVNHARALRGLSVLDGQISAVKLRKNFGSPKVTRNISSGESTMVIASNVGRGWTLGQANAHQLRKCLLNQGHQLRDASRKWFLG